MSAGDYYALEPEVAGEFGDETVMDHTGTSSSVVRLEYRLGWGWQGDELLESWPCFVATERLCDALAAIDATGYTLDDVLMSEDEQLADLGESYGELPTFRWLKIHGTAGRDDLGVDGDSRLVVSQRALDALSPGIGHCEVTNWAVS